MRAGRLVMLLGLLEARGRMTAPELATELEVSVRTVLRDVEELSGAGIPLYSVRGRSGGFELVGGRQPLRLLGWAAQSAAQSPSSPRLRATVRLSPHGRRLAVVRGLHARVRRRSTPVPDREDWYECTLEIDSIESAVHDLLALGAEVEVIRPPELRTLVAHTAQRIADLHGPAPTCAGLPAFSASETTVRVGKRSKVHEN